MRAVFRAVSSFIALAAGCGCLAAPPADGAQLFAKVKDAVVQVRAADSTGTGFAIMRGRYVVTCLHVVGQSKDVTVNDSPAKVVATDANADIAVLEPAKSLQKCLPLNSAGIPGPGTKVYVVGSASGVLDKTFSEGVIGGTRNPDGKEQIQIIAAGTKGSSGGPVMTADGVVVGVVTSSEIEGRNTCVAVPAADVRAVAWKIPADLKIDEAASGKVLGKLGQAIEATDILAKADKRSKVYYRAAKDDYFVLLTAPEVGWFCVLLQNGQKGYVTADDVAELPYLVTTNRKPALPNGRKPFGYRVAQSSLVYVGTPYRKGGRDPKKGFDAVGFVLHLWRTNGVTIVADLRAQAHVGVVVSQLEDLEAGDRLYFSRKGSGIDHVGVYLASGSFVHCDPSKGVRIDSLRDKKWLKALVAARR